MKNIKSVIKKAKKRRVKGTGVLSAGGNIGSSQGNI